MRPHLVKLAATLALGTGFSFAYSDSFSVIEGGTYNQGFASVTVTTTPDLTLDNTTWVTSLGGTDLSLVFDGIPSATGAGFTGTMAVKAGTGFTGELDFAVKGTIYTGLSESIAGTAVLTGSTGSFSTYGTGVGNFAFQLVHVGDGHIAVGTVSADVQPLPEPSGLALIGFAGVGIALVRRKR